jgi:ribulose-5-phosphate 4-epimerase/fuculose-1-phosphate aldolase
MLLRMTLIKMNKMKDLIWTYRRMTIARGMRRGMGNKLSVRLEITGRRGR